jgi:Acetyltransferases, including N-acetylases of ribosomal proteins
MVVRPAEQWALSKAGFAREGVLRGYGFRDGEWRDAVMYSILREDGKPGGEDVLACGRHAGSTRAPGATGRTGLRSRCWTSRA